MSITEQIETLFKRGKLPLSRDKFFNIDNRNDETITDIYDCSIYKNYRSKISHSLNSYSFTINTDGVSLCEKSNLAIWPVFLINNEQDYEERYYIYNTIIAGNLTVF